MTKIRHYRNIRYVWKFSRQQKVVSNLGGATIAYQELNEDTVVLGLALCVENFNKARGVEVAVKRLETMPVKVAKEELNGLFNMEDLYFSDLCDQLEAAYKSKGVNMDFYKAWELGLED